MYYGPTYVIPVKLAARDLVQHIVHLGHCHHFRVAEHRLVDGSGVDNGLHDKVANVSGVCESRKDFAITRNSTGQLTVSNVIERGRQRKLEPPTNIDDGIRKSETLHVVKDIFFLLVVSFLHREWMVLMHYSLPYLSVSPHLWVERRGRRSTA